jgi:hypothetical protein
MPVELTGTVGATGKPRRNSAVSGTADESSVYTQGSDTLGIRLAAAAVTGKSQIALSTVRTTRPSMSRVLPLSRVAHHPGQRGKPSRSS